MSGNLKRNLLDTVRGQAANLTWDEESGVATLSLRFAGERLERLLAGWEPVTHVRAELWGDRLELVFRNEPGAS